MKKIIFILFSVLLLSTGCKTFNYAEKQNVSINLASEDLEFGEIVTFESSVKKKKDFESAKQEIIAKLLKEYPEYDLLLFPKYELNSTKKKLTVSGRLAKIKK